MEINEFIKKKGEMEIDLIKAISEIVEGFKTKTGYGPAAIEVKMITGATAGHKNYLVSDVNTYFDWEI